MDREKNIKNILENKIIVIVRGIYGEELLSAAEAMYRGGIRLLEVTFDQAGGVSEEKVAENIEMLSRHFSGRMNIGAGTVMTEKQVRLAHSAGASFIISPDCYQGVIRLTRELGMVSIPGVFTPTEAAMAHRYGADFVKLFPNSEVNISYLRAITVPLSNIRFLAVGGVNEKNIGEYISAGAVGVGVATSIVDKTAIKEGCFEEIERRARLHVRALDIK